ncbi:hypothetical protein ABPG73_006019 [Tetrahymena malaccensis]
MGSNQENSLIQKKYIMEDYILNQTDKTISKKLKAKLYRDMKNRPFQQVICSVVNQKYQQYVAISNQTQQRSDQYQYLSSHQNQIVDEIIKEQNIDLKYFSNENKQKDLFQQDNLNLQQEKINYKNNPSQQNVIFNQQTSNQKQISLQQEDIKNNQNILKQIIQIQNISQYDLLKKQDSEQAQKDSDASNQLKDYLNMVVEQDDSRQSELQKLFSQIQQYSYEEYKQCQKWEQSEHQFVDLSWEEETFNNINQFQSKNFQNYKKNIFSKLKQNSQYLSKIFISNQKEDLIVGYKKEEQTYFIKSDTEQDVQVMGVKVLDLNQKENIKIQEYVYKIMYNPIQSEVDQQIITVETIGLQIEHIQIEQENIDILIMTRDDFLKIQNQLKQLFDFKPYLSQKKMYHEINSKSCQYCNKCQQMKTCSDSKCFKNVKFRILGFLQNKNYKYCVYDDKKTQGIIFQFQLNEGEFIREYQYFVLKIIFSFIYKDYKLLQNNSKEENIHFSSATSFQKEIYDQQLKENDCEKLDILETINQYSFKEFHIKNKLNQDYVGLGLTAQNCRSTKNQKQIMNQLTLCFNSRILEERFQKEITFTNQLLLRKVFVVHLILVITPSLIISTLQWEKAGMMLFTASMIGSLSQVLLYKMMQKCFNLVINSMILMSSIFVCILIYAFGTDLQINDPNMLFYLGSCIYTIQIGMSLFSSNFIMTSIAKNRRELFLSKENQKQWSEIVKKVIPSSIITVKYDQKNNQLFLDSINDEAKKLLQIFDQDQFKIFSRKTVVFDKFQEIDENEGNNNLEKKQIKQGQTVLNSLENRIISILKQKIQTFERQKSIQISKFKMGKSQDQENKTKPKNNKSQIQEIFYGCFKLEEIQIDKIISIKASPYQKQTDFLCCLVIEEQTNNQKIKALEIINKTFEVNFMQFCLYLENSIKFQRNEQLTTQYDQSVNASNRSRCQSSQYNIQTKRIEQESNYKDSVLSNFLIDFNDQAANKSVFKNDQSANKFEILNSTRNEGNISAFEVLQVQEMSLNKIDVNINIELIKGENQQSNIFKISVQDKGSGMRSSNLIQILEIIANKNTVFNSDYQNYNFIGWKDIDILNQTQINSKIKLFQNSQFQEYLQESNQNYYHVNNIEFLKENIKQNKKNSKIRMKNNSTLSNQLMFQQSNVLTSQFTRQQRTSSINRQIEFHKFNQSTSNYIEESECSLSQKNIKKYTSNQILTVQSALKINQEKFQGFQKYFQEENYEI